MKIMALDCDCGQHLESTNEEGLARALTDHMAEAHPDRQMDHQKAKEIVEKEGFDPNEAHGGSVDPRASSGA